MRTCALPEKFMRRVYLIREGMTKAEEEAAYVSTHMHRPSFRRADGVALLLELASSQESDKLFLQVCEELFTMFGLNQLAAWRQNKLPDKSLHCANLLCSIKFEVRNEIYHIQQCE